MALHANHTGTLWNLCGRIGPLKGRLILAWKSQPTLYVNPPSNLKTFYPDLMTQLYLNQYSYLEMPGPLTAPWAPPLPVHQGGHMPTTMSKVSQILRFASLIKKDCMYHNHMPLLYISNSHPNYIWVSHSGDEGLLRPGHAWKLPLFKTFFEFGPRPPCNPQTCGLISFLNFLYSVSELKYNHFQFNENPT